MALIAVKNTNGNALSIDMDLESTLLEVRRALTNKKIMDDDDFFIFQGIRVDISSEESIYLKSIVKHKSIIVGRFSAFEKNIQFDDFLKLSKDF
jgi:hypothetical protein